MQEKRNLIKLAAFAARRAMDALPPELKWMAAPNLSQWTKVNEAYDKGEPVNWHSFCAFPEVFHAMGIPSIMGEGVGAMTCSLPDKSNERYIDIAQEHLIADHVCSSQKIPLGAALCGELPPPTTICHPLQPCDSTIVTYAAIAEHLGVPHFGLDIPTWKDERAVQYVAGEIERMVAFLEEHTGKKLEYERLRQVMEYSRIAHEYSLKVNELTKMVPCPLPRMLAAPLMGGAGTPECAEYYQKLYEMGKARADKGVGNFAGEKLRLAWFSTWLAWDPQLFTWLEQEFGAVLVNTMLGTDTTHPINTEEMSSERKIYEYLAYKVLNAPMSRECWGTLEHWLDYAIPACRDWKVDAAILTLHLGCKNMWAVSKILKDRLADEAGVPTLAVEADFCDGRVFSSDGIRAQIKDFINTMLA